MTLTIFWLVFLLVMGAIFAMWHLGLRRSQVRKASLGLSLTSFLGFAFLYAPILVVAVMSFNDSRFKLEWVGFTTKWYAKIFGDDTVVGGMEGAQLLAATQNTLVLALISTAIATVIGALLGYGLHRYRFPGSRLTAWLMYIPVVTPDIVMAISLLLLYQVLRNVAPIFDPGMPTMVIAHVTFQIAFVAIVVRSRLATLDPGLEEAARDLYASPVQTVRHVVLPLALPGVMAGALLAFTLSIDDFVISFFTSGPESQTLPILIYSSVKRGITPDINALSTLIVALTIVGVLISQVLQRNQKSERLSE
jgi:spermidine/putrescine transport system permease protein